MDIEDAKKVARAALAADAGSCPSCASDVIRVLIEELPQFDWVAIAEEVAQEVVEIENGEELRRLDYFQYNR
jgi:hypothetical protein